jgi:hypothetical protein
MQAIKLSFEAWTAIISDLPCQELIRTSLAQIAIQRTPPEKGRFIRTPWESLKDKNLLTVGDMVVEYTRIQIKESSLSVREREWVSALVEKCILKVVEGIQAEMEAKKVAKAKRKLKKSRKNG